MTELQRLARCLADDYQFECQGGPLRNCTEWRALCAAIDTLAVDPPPSGASPQAETREDMGDGWYVTVGRWAESIVTIEQRSLSGKADLTDDDAALIRGAAKYLQAFIGQPVEPTPEPETCASECNPYMSRCGAKFCTFEDMAAHEQECKRLVPSEETPR